jgi:hypothetical protein
MAWRQVHRRVRSSSQLCSCPQRRWHAGLITFILTGTFPSPDTGVDDCDMIRGTERKHGQDPVRGHSHNDVRLIFYPRSILGPASSKLGTPIHQLLFLLTYDHFLRPTITQHDHDPGSLLPRPSCTSFLCRGCTAPRPSIPYKVSFPSLVIRVSQLIVSKTGLARNPHRSAPSPTSVRQQIRHRTPTAADSSHTRNQDPGAAYEHHETALKL